MILHKTYGLQSYSKFNYGENPQKYCNEPYMYHKEKFDSKKFKLLVIGDSFARDFINMLRTNININKLELILLSEQLPNINNKNTKNLLKDADIIISVSSAGITNTINKEELVNFSNNLYTLLKKEANGKVYRVGTKNFGYNNNFILQKQLKHKIEYKTKVNESSLIANNIEKAIWKENYIDVLSLFVDSNNKITVFTNDGDFISFDTEHATKKGAKFLGNIIINNTVLKNIIK